MLKFFRSSANQRLVARLLSESFRKHAPSYAIAIVAMLIVAAMTAASAWIMRDITNEFVITKDPNKIYMIAAAVAAIFITKGFATYVQALFLSRAGNSIIAERQRKIYDRMLDHGIEFYHAFTSSDLIIRLTQSAQAARSVVDILVTSFVRDLFSLIGLVLVMVIQQPAMSMVAFIFGPIAIYPGQPPAQAGAAHHGEGVPVVLQDRRGDAGDGVRRAYREVLQPRKRHAKAHVQGGRRCRKALQQHRGA